MQKKAKQTNKSHNHKDDMICVPNVACIKAPLFDAVTKNTIGDKK
jgi:hypothetical protein